MNKLNTIKTNSTTEIPDDNDDSACTSEQWQRVLFEFGLGLWRGEWSPVFEEKYSSREEKAKLNRLRI